MKRENATFLLGGIFLGFILGTVFALFLLRTPAPPALQATLPAQASASGPPVAGNQPAAGGAGTLDGGSLEAGGGPVMMQIQEKMGLLKKALEANPKDAALLGRLGDLYYDAGMFDQARDYYGRSLEIEPRNPNISTDLGICFHRLGRNDEAIQRFRASLEVDPGHWQSWLNLGIVSLFENQDVRTAGEAFARVKELNPSFEGLPQLEQALERAKAGGKP